MSVVDLSSWEKTVNPALLPMQKYDDSRLNRSASLCLGSRRQKKSVPDNPNCYDHNILGLQGRAAVSYSTSLHGNRRSKSQQQVTTRH
ncbi:MAG: hypothetical protein P4M11_15205 [Candidatus Pacebacteria bacterium]|nr:hypothetical protein [Candidatus Paceibacterota bacterium]